MAIFQSKRNKPLIAKWPPRNFNREPRKALQHWGKSFTAAPALFWFQITDTTNLVWAWPLRLHPPAPPSRPVGKTPISPHLHQLFLPPPPSLFFLQTPLRYQWTEDRLSEMFLLIPISFIITGFHVSGWPGPAGEGSGNYSGVPGINPTRCHWMACLPQWLMNGLLVSCCPPPTALLFNMEHATESICRAVTGLSHIRPPGPGSPPGPFSSYWTLSSVSSTELIRAEFHVWQWRQRAPWDNIGARHFVAPMINKLLISSPKCTFLTNNCTTWIIMHK